MVISYATQEDIGLLKVVNIFSNMTVKDVRLLMNYPDVPPLRVIQKEREETEMIKRTFVKSFPKFNDDQKRALNAVIDKVIIGLTSSAIQTEKHDIEIKEHEDLEIVY